MIQKRLFHSSLLLVLFLLVTKFSYAQVSGDPTIGKELFDANCAACHALDGKVVGPALGDVTKRRPIEWLQKWVKNNKALRESGDDYANKIFLEYKKVEMPAFENFSETDINNILAYTERPGDVKAPEAKKEETEGVAQADVKNAVSLNILIVGFIIIAFLLLWVLLKVNQLKNIVAIDINNSKVKDVNVSSVGLFDDEIETTGVLGFYNKYRSLTPFALILITVAALFGLWSSLIGIGVDKGYQPEQPIYFSHKIHSGVNKINCLHCHSSAQYGKVSNIPSVNVCMNCHKNIPEYKGEYIEEGKDREFYNAQLDILFDHSGWDKKEREYTKKPKPIEWISIHNLPDFVYFNHSNHVVVGEKTIKAAKGLKDDEPVCLACHGKIPEMDEVYMASPLTMGWCINCHRETEVDMGNIFNKEYYSKLHEKLKQKYGADAKVTVDAIGGMECGKCHY